MRNPTCRRAWDQRKETPEETRQHCGPLHHRRFPAALLANEDRPAALPEAGYRLTSRKVFASTISSLRCD
jgi:hypothetical protein